MRRAAGVTNRSPSHLHDVLESIYRDRHLLLRVPEDPIAFPHRYADPRDIEVAGLIAVSLAFGRIGLFKPVVDKILQATGKHPSDFVSNFRPKSDGRLLRGLGYRMIRESDLICWIDFIGEILRRHGSVEKLFSEAYRQTGDIRQTLTRVTEIIHRFDATAVYPNGIFSRGLLQLIPSPKHGGPCKRWNLYLRWMVRPADGIDFGLWKSIPPASLVIPLDTHIARISKNLGLTRRKTMSWAMAEEITDTLRQLDPRDPVKYDFALCHIGISGQCPARRDPMICDDCRLNPVCLVYQGSGKDSGRVRRRGA
jgi:uncharacterized protein (TIGR02757 family)